MEDEFKVIIGVIIGAIVIIGAFMWVIPNYKVYKLNLNGQAILREQEWEKKVSIEEAKAQLESSKLKALAEIERAKGVAEANKIIGDSLKDNEGYLRYLWIEGLKTNEQQVVYIPTEAGLPLLEARNR